MAICLSGIHYLESFCHWNGSRYNINYEEYIKNIKTKIYGYFEKDYCIDTFICTNFSEKLENLLKTYNVCRHCIEENNLIHKKVQVLQLLFDYINTTNTQYDLVLLTRFDIYIIKEFTNNNVLLDKFNIVSILEDNHLIDDNLFIFPIKYLQVLKDLLISNLSSPHASVIHSLKNEFEHHMQINYICNEPGKLVGQLLFFKLRFFNNLQLILNDYLFTENVLYYSIDKNSQMILNDNNIYFKKNVCDMKLWCWFGYKLNEIGFYRLTFDIFSNRNIIDFDFIKLHKPVKYYKISNIFENCWTTIDIIIETTDAEDLLCIIFDNFNDLIDVHFKNLRITPTKKKNETNFL